MGVEALVATTVASGVLQYANGKMQADALDAQAKFNAQQAAFNQQMLEVRKKDIDAQADEAVEQRYKDVAQILGQQKVAFAAGNIDLGSDVVEALEQDERAMADADVSAIRANARKEAMGIEIQKHDIATQVELESMRAKQAGKQSVVSGLAGAVSSGASAYGFYKKYS